MHTLAAATGRNYNTEVKHDLLDPQHIGRDNFGLNGLWVFMIKSLKKWLVTRSAALLLIIQKRCLMEHAFVLQAVFPGK